MSRRNKNILILDNDDQNTKYVFAPKGNYVVYLNFKSSITSRFLTNSKNTFEEWFKFRMVIFNAIS